LCGSVNTRGAQNTEADRDLTKAEILSAYDKAIINQGLCREMLLDLGYSDDEVSILISVKDYQTVKEIKARELKRNSKVLSCWILFC